MKTGIGLAIAGLTLVVGMLCLGSDRRGWTPAEWKDPATLVEPVGRNDPPFFIGDCLPGTIRAQGLPRASDHADTASLTVLTCRSRSGATNILLAYLLSCLFLALGYPVCRLITRSRHR